MRMQCIKQSFFVKQEKAYEIRISDWSSDVCSSDLIVGPAAVAVGTTRARRVMSGAEIRVIASITVRAATLPSFLKSTRTWHVTHRRKVIVSKIGSASCRERVCQYE